MKQPFFYRRSLLKVVVPATLAMAAGVSVPAPAAASTLEKVKSAKKILIGVRNDFPPVGSIDASGNPVGFGPDLGRALAAKLGVSAEFVAVTSRTRIALLEQGAIDIEIGVTTPTAEREKVVDFTIPYIWDSVNLLIRKGSATQLSDYGPPKKIATTQGSYVVTLLKERVPNLNLVLFQEFPEAVLALQNGRVDAVGINRASAVAFLKQDPNRLALSEDFVKDPWAIMVRKNDSDWRTAINHALQQTWVEGTYQALFQKHFGGEPNFYMWSPYMMQPGLK